MSFITNPLERFAHWVTHPSRKRVYAFTEGTADDKNLLGNKGANLCEMTRSMEFYISQHVPYYLS